MYRTVLSIRHEIRETPDTGFFASFVFLKNAASEKKLSCQTEAAFGWKFWSNKKEKRPIPQTTLKRF